MEDHHVISSILRHDQKQNSYKIALLRSLGDVALSFPGFEGADRPVAVPLRVLADYWIAYFWPFADEEMPILQGPRPSLGDSLRQDVSFRSILLRCADLLLPQDVARAACRFIDQVATSRNLARF